MTCSCNTPCNCDQPQNAITQAVDDALAQRIGELDQYTDAAAQSATESAASAEASANSAAATVEAEQNTLNIYQNAQALVPVILETSENIEIAAQAIESALDTASSITVKTELYTVVGGESTIVLDASLNTRSVQAIYIEGSRQDRGEQFTYNAETRTITLAETLPLSAAGTKITLILGTLNSDSGETLETTLASSQGASMIGTSENASVQTVINRTSKNIREHWSRELKDAGLTLVSGSFEEGGTVVNTTDAIWSREDAQCYVWGGSLPKTVTAGTTVIGSGGEGSSAWISVASMSLRDNLAQATSASSGAMLVGTIIPFTGAIRRTQQARNNDTVNVKDFGAVGDGTLHPLSEYYTTLSDAQAVYPFVTALTQSIDYAAIQAAVSSGAFWIVAPDDDKHYFIITDTILITDHDVSLDFKGSELKMHDSTGLKSHLLIQRTDGTQIQGNRLHNITFTNTYASTVYQVKTFFIGGFVVQGCVSWSPSYGSVWGFLDLGNAIMCYVRNCTTESLKDASVNMHGTGTGANRTVDICIYDNRFVDAEYGFKVGNYTEGVFARRCIIYAQRIATVGLIPESKAVALGSIKLQEIDFDSPNLTGSFLFARYVKNVQVMGSWFAGDLNAPMIRLEETDSVLISGNQAYPQDAFIADNGIGTTIVDNMIVGGTVTIQFGALADKTLVASNSIRGVVVCVDAAGHGKSLSVLSNRFESSSAAISAIASTIRTHVYRGNSGDNTAGVTTSSYIANTPYVTYTGPRPESISLRKATGVTQVVVNDVEIFNSVDGTVPSFIGVGELPPNTKISMTFNTGNNPWLNRIKQ